MSYIGPDPAEAFTSYATETFSVSATTSYTLSYSVANENELALFVNNVRQQPGSGKAYTATGTALTLSAATASTDTMYAIYLGRALQTSVPATNSITAAMVSSFGPAFHVRLSGNQTLSHDTLTRITWDTEVFDTDGAFASNVFTVPSGEGGKYVFSYCVFGDDSDDTDTYSAYIEVDGTQNADSQMSLASSKSALNMVLRATTIITLTAGQVVEVVSKHQGTSASEDVRSGGSFFSGYKLIGI